MKNFVFKGVLVAVGFLAGSASFAASEPVKHYTELKRENFQKEVDGKQTDLYTIKNKSGMVVKITNQGAKIEQILVRDKKGVLGDVAQGYETIDQVLGGQAAMGAFIGRHANRIAKGKFSLNGQDYQLTINNGVNHLHGGTKGSRFVVFDAKQIDESTVQMSYLFKDGEEGYPGNVPLRVLYTVTPKNEFVVTYDATTDKDTIVNFTSHAFFNLAGEGNGDILNHVVTMNSDSYTPVDDTLIPTGEILSVKGTPMDFTKPHKIGERIGQDYAQLKLGKGYDHNWVINKAPNEMGFVARVYEPTSGRVMNVYSNEPGMQLYTGNFLEGKVPRDVGKGGHVYHFRTGFSLEPHHFPNAPNQRNFPTTVLKAGDWYSGKIIYAFSVKK
jgi:aldose 1-epimerase